MNKTALRLSIILLLSAAAEAQFDTATVLDTVRDSSRSALVGASVSLVNTATGVSQTTLSNEAGDYQFFNVKIGRYKVTARKPRASRRARPQSSPPPSTRGSASI